MADNEAVYIAGAARFATYAGYSRTFRLAGPFADPTRGEGVLITAIDALAYGGGRGDPAARYWSSKVVRELDKAFAGFDVPPALEPAATGNGGGGGCGCGC